MNKNKHIYVTGASRGIGAAIALNLAEKGHKIIAQHSGANLNIKPPHPNIHYIIADFANVNAVSKSWDEAQKIWDGKIDILINNAGIFTSNPIINADDNWLSNWQSTIDINLTAAAILSRHAVMSWLNDEGVNNAAMNNSSEIIVKGRIINISSRAAHRGDSPDHWHYAAAKGGMVSMTKTIARAYAAHEILAFSICPGFTMTGMADEYLQSRGGEKLLRDIPLGRVATPQEIAEIASFCALNAPPSMTGAVMDVNGASYVR
ncbi:3-oxoacyl-ACP reductase [Sphingorhabdus lutea]|uniref:3-oxoacyl-ACP reductase n=1 Tax=Sphingorhabdus lutea TaxID=1913578 RepID=A0A1L3JD53_9SPHN|nr:SDR family oxidoreductase [Sphingorhabdus lutea]APG63071.1 3-oxoacyl-ACP reductase [Sphingorhabdus lutea]